MKCKNCGYDNMDGAKFCIECGTKLESENEQPAKKLTEAADVVESEPVTVQDPDFTDEDQTEEIVAEEAELANEEPAEADPVKEEQKEEPAEQAGDWYYVAGQDAKGPYTESQMQELAQSKVVGKETYVWKKGMSDWQRMKDSDLDWMLNTAAKPANEEPAYEDHFYQESESNKAQAVQTATEADQWFYVNSGKSYGPFNLSAIKQLIQNGSLSAQTYVWKEGMNEWAHLEDTELSFWLPYQEQTDHVYTASSARTQNNTGSGFAYYGVQDHSVIMNILLCIVTCGLWYFVWVYQLARDVNALAISQNKPKGMDPMLTLLLTLLTCGLFQIYFYWKEGQVLSTLNYPNYQVQNQGTIMALLSLFGVSFASAAILQDQINSIVKYGR